MVLMVIVVIMIRYVSAEDNFYLAAARQTDMYEIVLYDVYYNTSVIMAIITSH
jgi:hypothetical protein